MVPCPDGNCKLAIPLKALLHHMDPNCTVEHMKRALEHDNGVFTWTVKNDLKSHRGSNAGIFKRFGITFFAKLARGNGFLHTWVYIAAGSDISEQYQVRITITRENNNIVFQGKVFPIDVKESDVVKDETELLSLGEGLFNKLSVVCDDGRRKVAFKYEILKV